MSSLSMLACVTNALTLEILRVVQAGADGHIMYTPELIL